VKGRIEQENMKAEKHEELRVLTGQSGLFISLFFSVFLVAKPLPLNLEIW
jgi:hypothetical protein